MSTPSRDHSRMRGGWWCATQRGLPVSGRNSLIAQWTRLSAVMGWPTRLGQVPGEFLLALREPIRVSVCGARTERELQAHANRVDRGRWPNEILVVGHGPLPLGPRTACMTDAPIGLLLGRDWSADGSWGLAALMHCTHCGRPSFVHSVDSYRCRVSGCHDGDHHIGRSALTDHVRDIWHAIAAGRRNG